VTTPWRFGVEPLPQTLELAPLLRRVAELALALEHEDPTVDQLIEDLRRAERLLATEVPGDPRPRVGATVDSEGRAYVDHSADIGAFNPCFPEYQIAVTGDVATGTVTFPLAFEGPPGIVHGGFLGVFFDLVVQHHNCELGVAGKTTSMSVQFHRPTPLLLPLGFEIHRSVADRRITSKCRLFADDVVLCSAEISAVAGARRTLPAVSERRPRRG
jgi:hypothetical protein